MRSWAYLRVANLPYVQNSLGKYKASLFEELCIQINVYPLDQLMIKWSFQELKIRLEREKETSFKELKKQSIEYQKKLQEQLQEAVQKVTFKSVE